MVVVNKDLDATLDLIVATMNQKDFTKIESMNINSNVIFCNQANCYLYEETYFGDNHATMITTPYRGVSKNRNIGIMESSADICLFADDDMEYEDGYAEIVKKAFINLQDADVIIFNIDTIPENKIRRKQIKKIKRLHFFNILNYGAARIAIKRKKVINNSINFSLAYGGGAEYSCGEDSLFLLDCLKKKLKIYGYPITIAKVYQYESTWFKGYNKKYFFDKGKWIKDAFGKLSIIFIIIFSLKFYTKSELNFFSMFLLMYKGSRDRG